MTERPAPSKQTVEQIFVGRETELDALESSLAEAAAGHGRMIMLVGEPGIGKTRLAEELAHSAHRHGAMVEWGFCWENEGAPPLWPWIQVIRGQIDRGDARTALSQTRAVAVDIAQAIPEVREWIPDLPDDPHLEGDQARFRLFDGITTLLRHTSATQPLVLILEDLHWADKLSLLALEFLMRAIRNLPVLIIGTCRDVGLGGGHPLAELLGELARHQCFTRLDLRGLSKSNVARFLELTVTEPAPASLAARVLHETGGNPFFVVEIARLLVASDRQTLEDEAQLQIPQSVRDVIARRLSRLSPECNHVLTLACVLGREFDLNVLGRVSKLAGGELLRVLEEAAAAQLIRDVSGAVARYTFSHGLIRETLYSGLTIARRVRLHHNVGLAIEHYFGPESDRHFAELAYHFTQAAPNGDADKAVHYGRRAGRSATTRLAYEEATAHYERALATLETWKPADETMQCEVLLALGKAQIRADQTEEVREETFQRAAGLARKLGSPDQLARAALGLGARVFFHRAPNARLTRHLEEALETLDATADVLRARILSQLTIAVFWSDRARSSSLSREAVDIARRIGDPALLAHALYSRHWTLWGPDDLDERIAVDQEMVHVAEQAQKRELAMAGRTWQIVNAFEMGDVVAVKRELDAAAQLAEDLRQPFYLWWHTTFRTMQALLEGHFEEAESLARQALDIGQRVRDPAAVLVFACQTFLVLRERGRLHQVKGLAKDLVEQFPFAPGGRCVLALLYTETGRAPEARALVNDLARDGFDSLSADPGWLIALAILADTCAELRDAEHAAILYDMIKPFAGRVIIGGFFGGLSWGSASRTLGTLATTMQKWGDAGRHFEQALEVNARIGATPWLARTQCDYATMLFVRNESGGRKRAQVLLAEALRTAERLGMTRLYARALALQRYAADRAQRGTPARSDGTRWKRCLKTGPDPMRKNTMSEASEKRATTGPSRAADPYSDSKIAKASTTS